MKFNKKFKYLIFDADDTLWDNESFFRSSEDLCAKLLSDYSTKEEMLETLYAIEREKIPYYGYGIKGFMLCMIETAIKVSKGKVPNVILEEIIEIGLKQMRHPIVLLNGVRETIVKLSKSYTLVLATKGDLTDQLRKIKASGIEQNFHHIEVMTHKHDDDYHQLFYDLGVSPSDVCMIGNSMKSDVLPVIRLGGYAVYIPSVTQWELEKVEENIEHEKLIEIESFEQLLDVFE